MGKIYKLLDRFKRINKKELFAVLFILITGLVLRLYKISEYMTFLGDEGRDVLVVRKLLVDFDLIFVGPGTSIGNMYLGPMYYYMIAPFLYLWNFSPVGPSVFVALLGTATIYLVYVFTKEVAGKQGACWASFIYAISPTVIIFSKHSWNPNIMPFFSLLSVYCLFRIINDKKYNYIYLLGFCVAAIVQSHYLGLIMIPFILFFVFVSFASSDKKKEMVKRILISIAVFMVFMSPLFIFDFKYNLRNLHSFLSFFASERAVSFDVADIVLKVPAVVGVIVNSLLGAKVDIYYLFTVYATLFLFIFRLFFKREEYRRKDIVGLILVISWFAVGIVGLALYNKELYDHYFGFLFPAPFIILGILLNGLLSEKYIAYRVVGLLLPLPIVLNMIIKSPVLSEPSKQMARTMETARKIIDETGGNNYNLAVIAEQNYEGAYAYFLELWDYPPTGIDPLRYEETKTDYLYVVCEYEDREKCQPTSNPKTEIANFGWSKIEDSWEVGGVVLFKLVDNK